MSTLLQAGFGALAGLGASRQGNPRDGYGGFGAGYQAAVQQPYQMAQMRQDLQKGQQENQIRQAQIDDLPFVRGMRQAQAEKDRAEALKAGYVTTKNGGVFDTNKGTWVPGAEPESSPESLDQSIAKASADAQRAGRDPNADPLVKQLVQVKTSLQPPKDQKPDSPEQQFMDEYQRTHKGSTVQQAQRAYVLNQHIVDPAAAANRSDARSDKSYQFNVGQLNTLGKPITDRVTRLSTLQDTINQNSPQADSLIAPELLTVMAGGQGSGLRMNEAEIARVVGGRTNWESIKAAANKWQLDPSKGLSVTPAQRQQIRSLIGAVYGKLQQKQGILDQAQQDLIGSDDPKEHRGIVARARSQMTAIDQGQSGANGNGSHPLDKFWK